MGGTLIEKKRIIASDTPVLIIHDSSGVKYELRVTDDSSIIRNTESTKWSNLRIGDTVDVTCEYDTVKEVFAKGQRSIVEGYLEENHITSTQKTILLRNYSNEYIDYSLINGIVDVYALRIGMTVSLTLDSKEVYSIKVLKEAPSDITED